MGVIEGGFVYAVAGAPVAGTDEVQTISVTGALTGGTFKLGFEGFWTPALAYNVAIAGVDAALEALPSIGTGNVVTGGTALPTGPMTVTFGGSMAKRDVSAIQVDNTALVGGTLAVAITTPGVGATGYGAAKGALITDTTNGVLYINTGTPAAPVLTKVGTQT